MAFLYVDVWCANYYHINNNFHNTHHIFYNHTENTKMPPTANQAAQCATPVVPMPTGGHCNAPVPDCHRNAKLPELGNHAYRHTVGTSETAFNDRYDGSWFAAKNAASVKRGGGGSISRSSITRRLRGLRRRVRALSQRIRRTTKRQSSRRARATGGRRRRRRGSKRRGGTGYYLDLATCPAGGMPSPVKYDSRSPPVLGHQ